MKRVLNNLARRKKLIRSVALVVLSRITEVENLVKPGDLITIEFDAQERDKYRRLLSYIYLSNGKMLSEEIVMVVYANVMTTPPIIKYQDRFLRAYREVRERKRGMWQ